MITNPKVISADVQRLIDLFDATFYQRYNTRLVAGTHEPIYMPASHKCRFHQVIFGHGFFASALHEVAHWCLAGERTFNISTDNLNASKSPIVWPDVNQNIAEQHFQIAVSAQARHYVAQGLPERANSWLKALQKSWGGQIELRDFYASNER